MMPFSGLMNDLTLFYAQSIEICTAAMVTDATDGAKPAAITVLTTVLGSVQPYRKPPSPPADIAGVALEPPSHRAFMPFSSAVTTLGAFLRVAGVSYYPTKPPMDVGGQGQHLEVHLSTRRPA